MEQKVTLKWQDVLVHRASYTVEDGICAYEWKESENCTGFCTAELNNLLEDWFLVFCVTSWIFTRFFFFSQVFDLWSRHMHTYVQWVLCMCTHILLSDNCFFSFLILLLLLLLFLYELKVSEVIFEDCIGYLCINFLDTSIFHDCIVTRMQALNATLIWLYFDNSS